jgi:hypothetical protein
MSYCSLQDLERRLTAIGVRNVADRNLDGTASNAETAAALVSSIEYAAGLIDAAIAGQVEPTAAQGSGNAWLRDRAVDIAAYRAAGLGGRDIPATLIAAFEFSIRELERVRAGGRVPDLVLGVARRGDAAVGLPRAVNPALEKP